MASNPTPTPVRIVGISKWRLTFDAVILALLIVNTLATLVVLGNQQQQYNEALKVKEAVEGRKQEVDSKGVKCKPEPGTSISLDDFTAPGVTRFELPPPKTKESKEK